MGRKNKTNEELRNKNAYDVSRNLEEGRNQTDRVDDDVQTAEHAVTSVDVLVKAGSEEGAKWTLFHGQRKWALFRRSKPSKKKMIASLIEWGQDLSEQLHESNARERELQHEHEDLKCHNAQSEEKLVVMKKQVTHHKANEEQLEHKLEKLENDARETEDEVRAQQQVFELTKQRLEREIAVLEGEIRGKEEVINHTEDALQKCRHDCNNSETKYLTLKSEKSGVEDKLQASADKTTYLQTEIERLHKMLKTEEKQHTKLQMQLQKDLMSTRQVLDDSLKDKDVIQKQLSAEKEGFKYQVFMLSKALHESKMLVKTLRKEKQMLMFYYQDKLSTISQNKNMEKDATTSAICYLDKKVKESYLQTTTNILKNKVLDLEFNVYRYEKLTEALVDIIQSHDSDFVLEEEEILKSYLDNNRAFSNEPCCSHDLDLYSDDLEKDKDSFESLISGISMDVLDISFDVPCISMDISNSSTSYDSLDISKGDPEMKHDKCQDLAPSNSSDTCSVADSFPSNLSLAESVDLDTYETSTKYSTSDTCSMYSDFPTNGSS